mgnify:FL=1
MKDKKVRQYRSRQGRSDKKYSHSLMIATASMVCLIVILAILLLTKN